MWFKARKGSHCAESGQQAYKQQDSKHQAALLLYIRVTLGSVYWRVIEN
jgi:hypothetical protein